MSNIKLGSMDRISGLFHLPINEVFLGVKKTIDLESLRESHKNRLMVVATQVFFPQTVW